MPLTIDLGDDLSGKVNPGLMADLVIRIADSKVVRQSGVEVKITLSGRDLTGIQNRNLTWTVAKELGELPLNRGYDPNIAESL